MEKNNKQEADYNSNETASQPVVWPDLRVKYMAIHLTSSCFVASLETISSLVRPSSSLVMISFSLVRISSSLETTSFSWAMPSFSEKQSSSSSGRQLSFLDCLKREQKEKKKEKNKRSS